MTEENDFNQYTGDGSTPDGTAPLTRGESGNYLASDDLVIAVNTALSVGQPLLVTGDPGTGKTALAWSVASELGLGDVLEFHTRSDSQAQDVLYTFDHLARLFDVHAQDEKAKEPANYVRYAALGKAIKSPTKRMVLIDEIDKAPRDFPNDLLDEIDQMTFTVRETEQSFKAQDRPVVIITSNSERQLPDPFLRRCVFHHIEFPETKALLNILKQRLPNETVMESFLTAAIKRFFEIRDLKLDKKPATGELTVWVRVLADLGITEEQLSRFSLAELPAIGTLLKTRRDLAASGKPGR